jgi:ketosteroid isomerase-like protein
MISSGSLLEGILSPVPASRSFHLYMNRLFAGLSVLTLACCALPAQTPAPDAAAPGATSTDAAAVAQFQKVEDSWSDAVNRHDQYGLELVLSPLFVDVSSSGNVTTRNQQVALAINGDDKTLSLEQSVVTVRVLGDVAIANGTYVLHHKVNSAEVDEKGVFTHVYRQVHGGWLCINSQRTQLRADASAKTKKAQQSTAEEPLHIPFFSKSDKSSDQ